MNGGAWTGIIWIPRLEYLPRKGFFGKIKDLFLGRIYKENDPGDFFVAVTPSGGVITSSDGMEWKEKERV